MNRYEAAITSCVRTGVAEKLTAQQLYDPLINQLAVVLVGAHNATGARLEDLVEIIRHQLDVKVTEHARSS